jgi:hypothetical protein
VDPSNASSHYLRRWHRLGIAVAEADVLQKHAPRMQNRQMLSSRHSTAWRPRLIWLAHSWTGTDQHNTPMVSAAAWLERMEPCR